MNTQSSHDVKNTFEAFGNYLAETSEQCKANGEQAVYEFLMRKLDMSEQEVKTLTSEQLDILLWQELKNWKTSLTQ
ncbi:hypothetical protein [Pleionea sp. CnH1-48]|uniref:hypothetical protein n=1 Tax=Pleionea sp. CnH1-48 TaxID=2954494 RepID=UPI0020970C32|nr:hypothetical protein [Pleionea sp. CnH1-48]MCO7224556.1 hypothetical protein [Pleionea sp. CnH1-48]